MSDPRYSIIPAGAVTDDRLEGRDLQVLCFLGKHTDNLGWCYLSQVGMAEELRCGRSTVQRSLTRLYDAGWVEMKTGAELRRSHACHAYRVIMDRDDPKIGPSESEVEDQKRDARCPPVGTQNPPVGGGASPAGRPAQPYMGTERPKQEVAADGDARAGDASDPGPQAYRLSAEIAAVAGHAAEFLPPKWAREGARLMQQMLNAGYSPDMMRAEARIVMAQKRDGPPHSLGYFRQAFAKAHALQTSPLDPLPQVNIAAKTPEIIDAKTGIRPHHARGPSHSTLARDFARRAIETEPGGS